MNEAPPALASRGVAGFLPDLCTPTATLPLMVLAVLVALAIALARASAAGFWQDLGRLVLFCELLTLASAAAVCVLRRLLGGRSTATVAVTVLVALVAIAWGLAEAAYFLLAGYGQVPVGPTARLWWVGRIVLVAAIVDVLVLRYLYVSAEWRENVRREATTRLEALTARIRPHFLFNTLNTAASLVAEKPEAAERTLEDLAELFRASLAERPARVPLADEIESARRYLGIEALRLGPRLAVEWQLGPGAERTLVPPFILQPLVENAVTHGIEPRADGGTIRIAAARAGDRLEIAIANPLGESAANEGHGIGLAGVRARLALAYGSFAEIRTRREDNRFTVQLICPWEERGANPDCR